MTAVIRGSLVAFSVQFFNAAGDALSPATAELRVFFRKEGVDQTEEISLTLDSGSWVGNWESVKADPGTVYWSARAGGADPATQDGSFVLSANNANEQIV